MLRYGSILDGDLQLDNANVRSEVLPVFFLDTHFKGVCGVCVCKVSSR